MSSTEIYEMATLVQHKLRSEANCKDHNLGRLVLHAQLYDTLLEIYEEAEREKPKPPKSRLSYARGRKTASEHVECATKLAEDENKDVVTMDLDVLEVDEKKCEERCEVVSAEVDICAAVSVVEIELENDED
ncbi:hypothetical protein B0O99DRAFT_695297 [Bisporella sp. PMI_857]|nr:hypothetical protein B0O99DRAFT_695297 [Bisporella sp. PMI_857]